MIIATRDLDHFAARSDSLGGPGSAACAEYWANFEYRYDTVVDQALDPFSAEYVNQQIELYREISGRELDQQSNEHTVLNVEIHAAAVNPYAHVTPGALAEHMERLTRALRLAAPPMGGRLLDMGCGWGLSSEVAAYCGLNVTAVDVNPDFVDLVNRRARRFGHAIVAHHGTFDSFDTDQRFDVILFYECFHHALRPWDLLGRMRNLLAPGGKLVLAGEPINDHWWRHWGLRLDPMSVYCIRKFGWLESGWSLDFLKSAFERAGLQIDVRLHPEAEIGCTVIGKSHETGCTSARDIAQRWQNSGWLHDGHYMVCLDESRLRVPNSGRYLRFGFRNFRGVPVHLAISDVNGSLFDGAVPAGRHDLELDLAGRDSTLVFNGELWTPDAELHNGDRRTISLHLEDVTFS